MCLLFGSSQRVKQKYIFSTVTSSLHQLTVKCKHFIITNRKYSKCINLEIYCQPWFSNSHSWIYLHFQYGWLMNYTGPWDIGSAAISDIWNHLCCSSLYVFHFVNWIVLSSVCRPKLYCIFENYGHRTDLCSGRVISFFLYLIVGNDQ